MKAGTRSIAAGVALAIAGPGAGAGTAGAEPFVYAPSQDGSVWQTDGSGGGLVSLTPPTVDGGAGSTTTQRQIVAAVAPDARALYVPSGRDDAVFQFSIAPDGTLVPMASASVPAGDDPVAVAISPDGAWAYAVNRGDDRISQYSVARPGGALTLQSTVPAGDGPTGIAVSPDGSSVYVTNTTEGTISQFDVGPDGALAAKPTAIIAASPGASAIAVHPDGASVYVAGEATLRQYDVAAGGALAPKSSPAIDAPSLSPLALAVSPDGRHLYGAAATHLQVFTLGADGAVSAARYTGLQAGVGIADLTIAPDGTSLYAANWSSGQVIQWDRASDGLLTPKNPLLVVMPPRPGGGTYPRQPRGVAVTPSADLTVSATADPVPVAAGRPLTYTFTVSNSGTPASFVRLTDALPADATLQSATPSQGSCDTSGGVVCELGVLSGGATATVRVTVRPLHAGMLSNGATVEAPQHDPDLSDNTAIATATVSSAPLATTGAASELAPDAATLNGVVVPNGRPTTYRFEYGPDGTFDKQAPASPGDAGDGTDGVAVAAGIAGLQPATTYSYRLVAENADGATATGAARTFTTPARPVPHVDLALAGTATPGLVTTGDRLTFAFTITNRSATDAAHGVQLVDPLPGATAFDPTGSSPGCGTADGATVTCAVGMLAPGASATVQVALTTGQAGALANTALVSADEPDPNGADNVAAIRATVTAPAPPHTPKPAPTPPPAVTLHGTPALKQGVLRTTLSCRAPAGAECRGSVALTARVRSRERMRTVTLGHAGYGLDAGERATVATPLSRSGRRIVARARRVTATITVRLGTGRSATEAARKRVRLRAKGGHR